MTDKIENPVQTWVKRVCYQFESFSSKMEESLLEVIAPLLMQLGKWIEDNDIETRARLVSLEEQQEHTNEQIFKILDSLKMGDDINDNIREQLEDLPEGTDQIVGADISYGGTTDA